VSDRDAFAPRRSPEAAFYWEGVEAGELRYQVCNACGEPIFQPRGRCPYCLGDDLRIERSAGRGAIYSVSVVHQAVSPAFADKVPYALGIVELDEGYHMFSELVAEDLDSLRIGDRVEVRYDRISESVTLPVFVRYS
jgi:uncharacterized OB-fold protein